MKIRDVTAELLVWPKHEPEFWMSLVPVSHRHLLIVRVHTEDGSTGVGWTDAVPGAFAMTSNGEPRQTCAARVRPSSR